MPNWATVLMAVIGTVFTVSAASKVRGANAQRAFADSLRGLRLLQGPSATAVGWVVTGTELAIAGGLAVAMTARVAGGPPTTEYVGIASSPSPEH